MPPSFEEEIVVLKPLLLLRQDQRDVSTLLLFTMFGTFRVRTCAVDRTAVPASSIKESHGAPLASDGGAQVSATHDDHLFILTELGLDKSRPVINARAFEL